MAKVFTNAGLKVLTDYLATTTYVHVGWGSGGGTAAAADTTLFTEESEARVSGTQSQVTTTVADDTYVVSGTLTADADKTITNAGLFDAATAGNLLVKGDFPGIALLTGESIKLDFEVELA